MRVKFSFKTNVNIRKIATGKGDNYASGCLWDYSYFKENYKIIEIDLPKQQALDADPRATQQINFTANLEIAENTTMLSNCVRRFTRNCKSFVSASLLNNLIFISINDAIQHFKC